MRKLSLLWALLVSALFVVGCGPETPDTPNEPIPDDPIPGGVTPEITLAEVEVTFDSFTFEVTSNVEGELGYAVVADNLLQVNKSASGKVA